MIRSEGREEIDRKSRIESIRFLKWLARDAVLDCDIHTMTWLQAMFSQAQQECCTRQVSLQTQLTTENDIKRDRMLKSIGSRASLIAPSAR